MPGSRIEQSLCIHIGYLQSRWRSWFKGPNFSIYSCHFLSSWSGRMWSFAMGLFLISVSPTSLKLNATYGLCMGAALLLFGAIIGDWVDRTPRLKAAIISMALQNTLMVACTLILLTLHLLLAELGTIATSLRHALYAAIIGLSVSSRLMKEARILVVERDWIVEMCTKDEHLLAVMTSSLRRIDLLTKIFAPIVTGQILTYAGFKIGCGFIAAWCLLSLAVEYHLIQRVYNIVPSLKGIKQCTINRVGLNEVTCREDVAEEVNFKVDELDSGERKALQQCHKNTDTPATEKKPSCFQWKPCRGFVALYRGFRIYFRYETKWAGMALACLYLTVLGFDGITVGYATTQGFSGSILGIMMGVGAGIGILATFIYPFVVRRLGLARTGVLGIGLQVSCLCLCVVSIWVPGSPFDLAYEVESLHKNYSSDMKNKSNSDVHNLTVEMTQSRNNGFVFNSTLCYEVGIQSSNHSVWLLIMGMILARFGLWMADLTITQLFLERVVTTERGIVNGFQTSLNQLMDFFKYAIVVVMPHPNQFGILVLISFSFICTGWVLMGIYACKVPRNKTQCTSTCDRHERCEKDDKNSMAPTPQE